MPRRSSAARASARIIALGISEATRPARHVRHDDVFGDGHRRAEGEFLIDDDDAGGATVERRSEARRFAVDEDFSLARLKIAGEDVHQRGLAGAVLTNDSVHLAGAKADADMIERDDAGEPLGDPGDLEDIGTGRHRRHARARPGHPRGSTELRLIASARKGSAHDLKPRLRGSAWMAGTSPAMTESDDACCANLGCYIKARPTSWRPSRYCPSCRCRRRCRCSGSARR